MPTMRNRNTDAGVAAILDVFGSYTDFNDELNQFMARLCKEIFGVELEPGTQVKVEDNTVHTSLKIDITVGITLWSGPSWPKDIAFHHTDLDTMKFLTDEFLKECFQDHPDISTQSQVMAFA